MAQNFTTTEAAVYCGVSYSFLANARTYGGGPPFIKANRRVFYRQCDLDEWIEANRFSVRHAIPSDHPSRSSRGEIADSATSSQRPAK